MHCRCCRRKMCIHPIVRYKNGKKTCQICSKPVEQNYLPMREGKVDFSSDLFAIVCPECHREHFEKHKAEVGEPRAKEVKVLDFPSPKKEMEWNK